MMHKNWLAAICLTLALPAISSEDIDVTPDAEIRQAVDGQKGGSPELYRRTEEYLREYERMEHYAPKIERKTQSVNLPMNRLELPFELEVAEGYITTLTFLDARGIPFPTRVSRVGDSAAFIVCAGVGGDCVVGEDDIDIAHILTVGTTRAAGRTNLKVFFKGLHRAVQIPIVGRSKSYHDEVTIALPIENPDAPVATLDLAANDRTMVNADDTYARALIDNVAVKELPDATQLEVSSERLDGTPLQDDNQVAIFANGKTYWRTHLTRPNPNPTAITRGILNSVVYRFEGKPRAITAFDANGNVIVVTLTHPESDLGFRVLEK